MTTGDESGRPTGSTPRDQHEDAALRARLDALAGKLDANERRETAESALEASKAQRGSDLGQAFRLSTEFMAGVIAGGLLGWALDWALGTSPWGMIVCVMLGFGAGVMNAMRAAGFLGRKDGGGKQSGL